MNQAAKIVSDALLGMDFKNVEMGTGRAGLQAIENK